MAYSEEIAKCLIETLTKTAGLPDFQLAGHVPNLTFWMGEVRHAVEVVEGYAQRYEHLAAASAAFDAEHPASVTKRESLEYDQRPPRLALSLTRAEKLVKELRTVGSRVIDRCLREGLINLSTADELRDAMGGRAHH